MKRTPSMSSRSIFALDNASSIGEDKCIGVCIPSYIPTKSSIMILNSSRRIDGLVKFNLESLTLIPSRECKVKISLEY